MPNYTSRDMAIHAAADLEKALQTPRIESPFQVADTLIKAKRELGKISDAETKIPIRDALTSPPDLLMKKRNKIPRVEDQTAPPTSMDTDK